MSFAFVESNADFKALSKKGIKRVLLKADEDVYNTTKRAAACKMEIMLWLDSDKIKRKKTIVQHAGRIIFETGHIRFTSTDKIEEILTKLGKLARHIHGVVIPTPEIDGLLWNKEIEKLCGFCGDSQLYELFDEEVERSFVRSRFYMGFSKYIVERYMKPQKTFLEMHGIKAIFDISALTYKNDSLRKMLCPVMLKNANLLLATTREDGRVEKEIGFSKDDFVITNDAIKNVENESGGILLVRPVRGILERYIHNCKRRVMSRIETPALSTAVEGMFYSTMLEEKGYTFDVADEFSFYKEKDFSKYKAILICESCLFEEAEMKKIKALEEKGIDINPTELICDLMAKGEEEWEK